MRRRSELDGHRVSIPRLIPSIGRACDRAEREGCCGDIVVSGGGGGGEGDGIVWE